MQMFKVLMVAANHPQDVVGLPSHQMAFEHFGNVLHCGLEGIESCLALAGQADFDEELHGKAQLARIKLGTIALYEPTILQRLDAPMTGGGRQANRVSKDLDAAMGIALQLAQ